MSSQTIDKTGATATLLIDDKEFKFPVHEATIGKKVINVKSLKGYFTFDPGFMATAACESKLTYIDGDRGILLHRGYSIEQLAEKADFLEVVYLLLKGELPNTHTKQAFDKEVQSHTVVNKKMRHLFKGFRRDSHPMAMLLGSMGSLSAFYAHDIDLTNSEDRLAAAIRLIAKIPTLAAMCYKYSIEQNFVSPKTKLGYAENFLTMMFSSASATKIIDPVLTKAIDQIFILHADHEQNASTSTVRLAGSTGANPYACISAGVAALWGPAHGGANEACLRMLHEISDIKHIPKYIKRAKNKDDTFRLMGFGHRVYKSYDPRAKIMCQICHTILDHIGLHNAPLFKLALELERIALEDNYFVERNLYPNIDFYSGLTLNALGIPMNMFTVIFALARTSGWVAHWHEMLSQTGHRISRPRQLYTGPSKRDFIPLQQR